jgi:hypothetical protein
MAKLTLRFVKPSSKNMFKGNWQDMGDLAIQLKEFSERHNVDITFELPVSKEWRGANSIEAIGSSVEPVKHVDVIIGTNGKVISRRF